MRNDVRLARDVLKLGNKVSGSPLMNPASSLHGDDGSIGAMQIIYKTYDQYVGSTPDPPYLDYVVDNEMHFQGHANVTYQIKVHYITLVTGLSTWGTSITTVPIGVPVYTNQYTVDLQWGGPPPSISIQDDYYTLKTTVEGIIYVLLWINELSPPDAPNVYKAGSYVSYTIVPNGSVDGDSGGTSRVVFPATGSELDTGTDNNHYATAYSIADSHNVPSVEPSTAGNVMTSNGTDWISTAASGAVADIGSTAETLGEAVSNGVATTASRSDHKHAITNPAIDTLAAATNITTLDATTTAHGLAARCVAPSASTLNVLGVAYGETVYTNKTIREVLTASRTYYVRTDGHDGASGLNNTSNATTGAFLTIQHSINIVMALDLGVNAVTIQVGNGTYAENLILEGLFLGSGQVTLRGDSTTPANVIVDKAGTCLECYGHSQINVSGIKFGNGAAAISLQSASGSVINITGKCEFGATTWVQLYSWSEGSIVFYADARITGGSGAFIDCSSGGQVTSGGGTWTLVGTPAFSAAFVIISGSATVSIIGVSFSGSATGLRFSVSQDGSIFTNGAGLTYFPGNTAGTLSTGGVYDNYDGIGVSGGYVGFYGTFPIAQPAAATDLGTVLSSLGLRAAGTAYPITTSGVCAFSGNMGFFGTAAIAQPIAATDLGTVLSSLGLRVAGTAYPITTSGAISMTGATIALSKITTYNTIATVNNGVASEIYTTSYLNQTALIAATTLYAVPASGAGYYRVSWFAVVNRAATTSSTLGGTTGFQSVSTVSGVVKTSTMAGVTSQTSTTNSTATGVVGGVVVCYCDASTNLQFVFGYTSSGATTMRYDLYITVEKL